MPQRNQIRGLRKDPRFGEFRFGSGGGPFSSFSTTPPVFPKPRCGFFGAFLKHSLVPLRQLCQALPERGCVIDFGCGEGMLSNLVAHQMPGLTVRGIDTNHQKISIANLSAPSNAAFTIG